MNIYLDCSDAVMEGVKLLRSDLHIDISGCSDAKLWISEKIIEDDILRICCTSDVETGTRKAVIAYNGKKARFFRGLGILIEKVRKGTTAFSVEEHPLFSFNGAMFDVSRNAVMTVETVQFTMRKMALMGLNTYLLYTEDTYEVPNHPYFGYMRGRYSQQELRALDAYAGCLGIELIPCIQTLGHLTTYLRWQEAGAYRDTANALLAGAEETRRFLRDLFAALAACFSSRRVHIGMDETHDLGTGASLDRFGYQSRKELYFKQLAMVVEIAADYGFHPMMWSDMFFRLSADGLENYEDYDLRTSLLPDIRQYIPSGVQMVFWDYYRDNEYFYSENLKKHKLLCDDTVFAGGVWAWSGHAVQYSRSIRNSVPALDACRETGTKSVLATVWNNGAEAFLVMALAGIQLYAEYDYHGSYDEKIVADGVARCLGVSYYDFLKTESVEYPHLDPLETGASRVLLYNDPLCGLIDRHVNDLHTEMYYQRLTSELQEDPDGKDAFSPGFEVLCLLSSFLENKADFGLRVKAAYDAQDDRALYELCSEIDVMRRKLSALRTAHRAAWMHWYKPFGWEIHDIRYGGLDARLDTAKCRLQDYLAKRICRIEELEEPRLRFDGADDSAPPFTGGFLWAMYRSVFSAGIL